MNGFMIFALGMLAGVAMGGIGMLLLIKETRLDMALDAEEAACDYTEFSEPSCAAHCKTAPAPELDWNDLELPMEEVKYGNF